MLKKRIATASITITMLGLLMVPGAEAAMSRPIPALDDVFQYVQCVGHGVSVKMESGFAPSMAGGLEISTTFGIMNYGHFKPDPASGNGWWFLWGYTNRALDCGGDYLDGHAGVGTQSAVHLRPLELMDWACPGVFSPDVCLLVHDL